MTIKEEEKKENKFDCYIAMIGSLGLKRGVPIKLFIKELKKLSKKCPNHRIALIRLDERS